MDNVPSHPVTAGDVQDLAVAVEQLTEETRLLRTSLDELRDDVVWAARQVLESGYQVTGTSPPPPRDPVAPEMPTAASCPAAAPSDEHRRDESPEDAGTGPYCCDRPRLTWNGDPDAPGVACEHCGYVVADNGSVVMWPGADDSDVRPPAPPEQRQGSLFS